MIVHVPDDAFTLIVPAFDTLNVIAVVLPKSVVVVSDYLEFEPSQIPTTVPALMLEPLFAK